MLLQCVEPVMAKAERWEREMVGGIGGEKRQTETERGCDARVVGKAPVTS